MGRIRTTIDSAALSAAFDVRSKSFLTHAAWVFGASQHDGHTAELAADRRFADRSTGWTSFSGQSLSWSPSAEARAASWRQVEEVFERLWVAAKRCASDQDDRAPHYRRFVVQQQKASSHEHTRPTPRKGYASLATNDGKGILFVSHNGAIYPSGFMPITAGTFPADHIVNVYRQSPIFQALRDANLLEGKCGDCEFRKLCGGSRARAYAVTGNSFAEEPDCVYVPTDYQNLSGHASSQRAL
jgi:radical SAM protein with 4Fe4S-binding SPASM domain